MKENTKIIKRPGDTSKIYCEEEYAQDLYDRMMGIEIVPKDLKQGDVLGVKDFRILKNTIDLAIFNHKICRLNIHSRF